MRPAAQKDCAPWVYNIVFVNSFYGQLATSIQGEQKCETFAPRCIFTQLLGNRKLCGFCIVGMCGKPRESLVFTFKYLQTDLSRIFNSMHSLLKAFAVRAKPADRLSMRLAVDT